MKNLKFDLKPFKLDLGCGLNRMKPFEDWIHLDCDPFEHIEIVCDFGKIPLDNEVVDQIHIGDVIEHIPSWRWTEVMSEWKRILKPGGILEGSTPNFDHAITEYHNKRITLHEAWQMLYGDRAGYPHQHYQVFTMERLRDFLHDHGFKNVDFSDSPGPKNCPWWLVFKCIKP